MRIYILIVAVLLPTFVFAESFSWGERNTEFPPQYADQFRAELVSSNITLELEVLAQGLEHPWGIAVLPQGGYLVTERAGRLRYISANGEISEPISGLPNIAVERQGGLLDVTLSPDFITDRMIYWTYAKPIDGKFATAAGRGRLSLDNSNIENATDIFVQQPASPTPMHFGSRLVFDGQGHIFITTGEHSTPTERVLAQELSNTYGKVIRIKPEGTIPKDNPFVGVVDADPSIWSYGHRNMQGAMMRGETLWTIEHGPKGGDEINVILAGKNYGWPVISYGENYSGEPIGLGESTMDGMEQPLYFWDPVIAPAGMVTYEGDVTSEWQGDVLISSLNPGGIVRLEIKNERVVGEERLLPQLGRVRDLAVDSDGSILALTDTSNGLLVRVIPVR